MTDLAYLVLAQGQLVGKLQEVPVIHAEPQLPMLIINHVLFVIFILETGDLQIAAKQQPVQI
jgi:hypothetical protein